MKLASILKEIQLTHRRTPEERHRKYNIAIQKKIDQYIKGGGQGDLDLSDSPISSLPANLKVGGNLSLLKTNITALPQGLEVGGDLNLAMTPITSLPQGLQVNGDLTISDTKITSLPNGLKIAGDFHLRFVEIESLPPDLQVGGILDLWHTPISIEYTKQQIRKMVPGVKGEIWI